LMDVFFVVGIGGGVQGVGRGEPAFGGEGLG
jgi:hypothetical protein